jgi:hypothetical protein
MYAIQGREGGMSSAKQVLIQISVTFLLMAMLLAVTVWMMRPVFYPPA